MAPNHGGKVYYLLVKKMHDMSSKILLSVLCGPLRHSPFPVSKEYCSNEPDKSHHKSGPMNLPPSLSGLSAHIPLYYLRERW